MEIKDRQRPVDATRLTALPSRDIGPFAISLAGMSGRIAGNDLLDPQDEDVGVCCGTSKQGGDAMHVNIYNGRAITSANRTVS